MNYSLFSLFREKTSAKGTNILFSIVVAAKNESSNIKDLISYLDNQAYPKDSYEVIIVDDNSADDTYENACKSIQDKKNFKVIKALNKPFPAKKGALAVAMAQTKNPFIMITDADCRPEVNWLKSFSEKFLMGYDFLFGNFLVAETGSVINSISRFTSLRSSFMVFSAAWLKLPYCASANSLGFRKKAFDRLGGYSNTLETLSGDDDLLIREAVKNNFRIGTVTAPGSAVHTFSKENFKEYLQQKARHTSASNYYLPVHKLMLAVWHLLNILFVFSPVLAFFSPYFILPFIVKVCADIITVRSHQEKFACRFKLFQIICLQFVYEIMLIVNYLNSLSGKSRKWA